ncbi:hypothetical protein B296_00038484 [Ensete ventricosum]|uniref:Uncharacterized protein n=1 Tax=Ensete ventricosum TaxID=4639 RepID=A0A426ZW95_ENSVE|nr:hypothetical protein B296_00038484 [Ensete ventricosum]
MDAAQGVRHATRTQPGCCIVPLWQTLASTDDEGPKDTPEELASGSTRLVPPDPAEGTTLALVEESEEVIPTYSQRPTKEMTREEPKDVDPRRSEVSMAKQETYRVKKRQFSFPRQGNNSPRNDLSH